MTREEFLRSLKPGDRVGVSQRYDPYVAQVMRVTRSGQITIRRLFGEDLGMDNRRFTARGSLLGATGNRYYVPHLVPVEEIEEQLALIGRQRHNREIAVKAIDLLGIARQHEISPERKAEILALVEQLETTKEVP